VTWIERRWEGDPGATGGRTARQSFTYRAFVPDPIAAIRPVVSFETAGLISEAETAVGQLNSDERVRGLEAIGALLLRSEAIASSRIEGIELSQRDLARALIDPRAARGTARAVAANVVAMEQAIALGDGEQELTAAGILAIHGTLMAHEPPRVLPGPSAASRAGSAAGCRTRPMPASCRRRRTTSSR
jgi:Fic family protein